jgi:predicted nucleic acid-binding protein
VIFAVDTNVLVDLWAGAPAGSGEALEALRTAQEAGKLVICAPVFSELLAGPGFESQRIESLLDRAGIGIDWVIGEEVWRLAGRAFADYAGRKRRGGAAGPRRLLTDFVIGAHALLIAGRMVTRDAGLYRAAFPQLQLIAPGR